MSKNFEEEEDETLENVRSPQATLDQSGGLRSKNLSVGGTRAQHWDY